MADEEGTEREREEIALERERLALERELSEKTERERLERKRREEEGEDNDKGKDNGTVWMFVALGIFLIDAFYIPGLGDRYSGFTFAWWTVSFDLFLMVATSGLFATFVLINVIIKIFYKDFDFIYFLIVFFVINNVGKIFGYTFNFGSYAYILIIAIIIAFAIYYYKRKGTAGFLSSGGLASLIFYFVYSFFILNAGWAFQPKAIIHFIFITVFGYFFIKAKEKEQSSWYYWTIVLLLTDFFGYNVLKHSVLFTYIPFLFFFVVVYVYTRTQNKKAVYMFIGMIILMIFISLDVYSQGFSKFGWVQAEQPLSITERVTGIGKSVGRYVEHQLEFATGGLYRGFVEKNQFEPLGVFFDKIRAAQPRFYADEDVTLWAVIKSRTLSDPVVVDFACFRWENGKRVAADKSDIIVPGKPFTVYTLEEKDVECTFVQDARKSKLEAGTNIVTLSAAYNFATSAYQKAYFIDKDRLRAMVRENLDPLKEFGITDTAPKAVYTNGPVEIGIGMQTLVPVSDEIEVKPVLGVSLINRNKITDKQGKILGEWDGKIKKINELVIILPKHITIHDPKEDCKPLPFKEFKKEDCSKSCDDSVYLPCKRACGESDGKCASECSDAKEKCAKECTDIFKGDAENAEYTGYQLDVEQLKNKDEYKDIDRFRAFACRITPAKKVLENTPVTTKFIRVRAKYDYLLEKSVSIIVEEAAVLPSSVEFDVIATDFSLQIHQGIYFNQNNPNEIEYTPITFETAKNYNVDYLLVKSIIETESKWNPDARGDNGNSFGLMQVSKDKASSAGCSSDFATNPKSNIDCGVKYISKLIKIQKDNNLKPGLRNIAAAYDCGEATLYYDDEAGYENSAFWENPANCWSKDKKTSSRAYVNKVMNVYETLLKRLKK